MTLKDDSKFKGKLTVSLKNDIRMVNFYASSKICSLMGSFCPNHINFKMKKYREVMSHDTEE